MEKPLSILITGANGQLGQELQRLSNNYSYLVFHFYTREQLSIQDEESIARAFQSCEPDVVINCAAYTAVDRAENEKDAAYLVNALGPSLLAAACANKNVRFIHISTDYVFDGRSSEPYKEGDDTNPQSVYGKTKLEGEKLVMGNLPSSIIIRTSWVYSEFGKNFVKTMIRLMDEKPEVNIVSDQYGSPTYAADLADAILKIVVSDSWVPGIYHFSNAGIISWYDLAVAIRDLTDRHCIINQIPTTSYPTPAKRPAYSGLDKSKFSETYQIDMKHWKESLINCLDRIAKKE